MMTTLLSVGAWAADDLTLNPSQTVAFGEWGFDNSGAPTLVFNDWSDGGGWVFDTALSKNDYYGVDFTFGAATTEDFKLIIVYNDATPTTQEIAVPSGSTNIHAVFNTNEDIKKIGLKMSDSRYEGSYSNNITITSAVVKAYGNDRPLYVENTSGFGGWGFNSDASASTITLSAWVHDDGGGWSFANALSQDNYCGINFDVNVTGSNVKLLVFYAGGEKQTIEVPTGNSIINADFIYLGNISKIGFGNSTDTEATITINSAVVKAESKGEVTELLFSNLTTGENTTRDDVNNSFTMPCYTWGAYWAFSPAISSDDYEKVVITFSEPIPNKPNLAIHAHENSGSDEWNGTQIGTLTGGTNKATAYFSNKLGVNIDQLGFYFDWNDGQTASTLSIASAKLYKKPTKSITIGSMTHGTVTASVTEAWEGKTVILTPVPDGNYELGTLTVTDGNSDNVTVTNNNGTYTFTMPATAVTVNATFNHVSAVTLSTDKLVIYNKAGGSRTDETDSTVKLWVDTDEYSGWDLTVGRPVTTDEFSGIQVLYKEAQKIKMQVIYGDNNTKWESSEISATSGSNTLTVNFAAEGISGVVKSIMFVRYYSNETTMIQFQSKTAVSLQIKDDASYSTPRTSLKLTYETLEDTGMDGETATVTYVKEDKAFTIAEGNAHWAFWDFILPLPTTLYNGIYFKLTQAPAGSKIEIIYDGDGDHPQVVSINDEVTSETTYNVDFNKSGNVTRIRFAGAGTYKMGTCTAKPAKYQVTVSAAKYATFGDLGSPDVINYGSASPSGLKAYIAYVNGDKVKLEEVSKASANTAVILYADVTVATSYTVTTTDESASTTAHTNELHISDGTVTGNESTIYVLANGTKGVGFYLLKNGDALAAGKAYLEVSGGVASSRQFIGFGDDNETTGIQTVANSQQSAANSYYDLQGRRVAHPTKGLYVVNGKKVIIK